MSILRPMHFGDQGLPTVGDILNRADYHLSEDLEDVCSKHTCSITDQQLDKIIKETQLAQRADKAKEQPFDFNTGFRAISDQHNHLQNVSNTVKKLNTKIQNKNNLCSKGILKHLKHSIKTIDNRNKPFCDASQLLANKFGFLNSLSESKMEKPNLRIVKTLNEEVMILSGKQDGSNNVTNRRLSRKQPKEGPCTVLVLNDKKPAALNKPTQVEDFNDNFGDQNCCVLSNMNMHKNDIVPVKVNIYDQPFAGNLSKFTNVTEIDCDDVKVHLLNEAYKKLNRTYNLNCSELETRNDSNNCNKLETSNNSLNYGYLDKFKINNTEQDQFKNDRSCSLNMNFLSNDSLANIKGKMQDKRYLSLPQEKPYRSNYSECEKLQRCFKQQQYNRQPCKQQPCKQQPCKPQPCKQQPCKQQPCKQQPYKQQPYKQQPCKQQSCNQQSFKQQPCKPQPCKPQPCKQRPCKQQCCCKNSFYKQPGISSYKCKDSRACPCKINNYDKDYARFTGMEKSSEESSVDDSIVKYNNCSYDMDHSYITSLFNRKKPNSCITTTKNIKANECKPKCKKMANDNNCRCTNDDKYGVNNNYNLRAKCSRKSWCRLQSGCDNTKSEPIQTKPTRLKSCFKWKFDPNSNNYHGEDRNNLKGKQNPTIKSSLLSVSSISTLHNQKFQANIQTVRKHLLAKQNITKKSSLTTMSSKSTMHNFQLNRRGSGGAEQVSKDEEKAYIKNLIGKINASHQKLVSQYQAVCDDLKSRKQYLRESDRTLNYLLDQVVTLDDGLLRTMDKIAFFYEQKPKHIATTLRRIQKFKEEFNEQANASLSSSQQTEDDKPPVSEDI